MQKRSYKSDWDMLNFCINLSSIFFVYKKMFSEKIHIYLKILKIYANNYEFFVLLMKNSIDEVNVIL